MDTPEDAKYSKMTANQIAIEVLSADGEKSGQIAKRLGLSTAYVSTVRNKPKRRNDLTAPKAVKSAYKTILSLAAGLPIGQIKEVKDSTVLRAAEAIMDRAQPKVTQAPVVDTFNLAVILQQAHASLRGVMLPPSPVAPLPPPPLPDGSFERFRRDRIARRQELRRGAVEVDNSVRAVDNSVSEGGYETGGGE